MDPVSLVVAALAAGASAALKDAAGTAVQDAYNGLKELLKRKLRNQPLAQVAINEHEEAPDLWEKPLQDELARSGVADNEDVLSLAKELLALVDPAGSRSGKYNVTVTGGKGVVVGDHARVEMTFEDEG